MKTVDIELDKQLAEATAGLTKASDFYEKIAVDPQAQWLYLGRDGDINIPLLPDDYIIIHGGEKIFKGEINRQIEENPSVRSPLKPTFNDQKIECDKAKITGQKLRQHDKELLDSKLFADLADLVDTFIADDWILIVQNADCYFTIPSGDDDAIDLEECAKLNRRPPKGQHHYKIKIDGEKYKVPKSEMSGEEILNLVSKSPDEWNLNQKYRDGKREAIAKDETVDFTRAGVERFETVKIQAQQG